MKLRIKYFKGATKLKKISKGNWIDVYASEDVFAPQGERTMIPLGFALELPKGWEGHLTPRSSTFKTWGVIQTNGIGVVDDTYIGNNDMWMMPVYCLEGKEMDTDYGIIHDLKEISKDDYYEGYDKDGKLIYVGSYKPNVNSKGTWIRRGDKVAQFRIMEVMPEIEFEEVEVLNNEDRKGFGTTGTK